MKNSEPYMNAFEKYLLSISRAEAISHIISCLRSGPGKGEAAWDLLERAHGDSPSAPESVTDFVASALDKLERGEVK